MKYDFECVNLKCGHGWGTSVDPEASIACEECGEEMVPVYQGENLTNDEILAIMQDTLNAQEAKS